MVEQWCVKVPAAQGETVRQALISEGALDNTLKVRREGMALLLPVTGPREGAERCEFEPNPARVVLPRHELVGGIAIMQECDKAGAELILTARPSLYTVVWASSEVAGEYRTREFEVLAGKPTTRTEVIEYGHHFIVDLSRAYFSARLSSERQRLLEQAGDNEIVLDMFAGVGPFAITLAAQAAFVVAADLNPQAIELMLENLTKNRVKNVLPMLADAHRLPRILPWKFDRIVMNLPLSGTAFLEDAFRLCRPGGAIHFYSLVSEEGEHTARVQELGGEVIAERVVRSYSPAQWHAVYDILVKKCE
jgi:tRNA (guanine37-N1)-methyltransferase